MFKVAPAIFHNGVIKIYIMFVVGTTPPSIFRRLTCYTFLNATPSVIISRALTPPSLQKRSFNVARYNGTLKVPASAIDAYKEEWMIDQAGYLGWDTARWSIQVLKDGE